MEFHQVAGLNSTIGNVAATLAPPLLLFSLAAAAGRQRLFKKKMTKLADSIITGNQLG